jgi:hypothetical protein
VAFASTPAIKTCRWGPREEKATLVTLSKATVTLVPLYRGPSLVSVSMRTSPRNR